MRSIGAAILIASAILTTSLTAEPLDKDTEKFIQQEVERRWQEIINSDAFQTQINEGILRFVNQQNQAQRNSEAERPRKNSQQLMPVTPGRDHIRGDINAEFTLLEYSDFECPFCKRFHETVLTFTHRHPDVNWVYRHYPLNSHNPGAQQQAEASECVSELGGNDAFWSFVDTIYKETRSGGRGFPANKLEGAAVASGVDGSEFTSCLNSGKHRIRVLTDLKNGEASGITGTPGNFLIHNPSGNLVVISGAQPLEVLERTLTALREQFSQP